MVFYTPSPNVAYSDMWNILGNVPLGQAAPQADGRQS